jgi:transcriptional regulator with XRE-family HTH domain
VAFFLIIGASEMAKKKVRPCPGALLDLLKRKGMTQMDAAVGGVDRKTLRKINLGDQVKLETLQKLATTLHVPVSHFLETSPPPDQTGGSVDPTYTVIMLRKLNAERLAELIKGAQEIRWLLNVQVIDNNARELLEHLEFAVSTAQSIERLFKYDLREQLRRLQAVDSFADLLQKLGKHRLAVLGAEYLHWNAEERNLPKKVSYTSHRYVLLSVDPSSTQSRRVRVDQGAEPPKSPPDTSTIVYVDGRRLDTGELDLSLIRKDILF